MRRRARVHNPDKLTTKYVVTQVAIFSAVLIIREMFARYLIRPYVIENLPTSEEMKEKIASMISEEKPAPKSEQPKSVAGYWS